jgi:hypothetical protein
MSIQTILSTDSGATWGGKINANFTEINTWQAWTPTWTNVTVGDATITARYNQTGKTVFFRLYFKLGSTTSIGASFTFSLPITMATYTGVNQIGSGLVFDAGSGSYPIGCNVVSTTTAKATTFPANSTYLGMTDVSTDVPFTMASNDVLTIQGFYEVA